MSDVRCIYLSRKNFNLANAVIHIKQREYALQRRTPHRRKNATHYLHNSFILAVEFM